METKIKSTLFRFANLRSPELSEEKNQAYRFVFFPETFHSSSFFYETTINNPSNTTKWEVLKNLVRPFEESSSIYQSDQEIKNEFNSIYNFSVWLIRNKSTCTEQELHQKITDLNFTAFSTAKMVRLWDNLFYQTVSQKSFYTKELIMQLLLANHVATPFVQEVTNPITYLMLAKARVVLPREMFFQEKTDKGGVENKTSETNPALEYPTVALRKQQIVSLAKRKIEHAESVKKELLKSEKKYRKTHRQAYELAQKNHEALIAPILAQHEEDVEEERQRWCSVTPSTTKHDPNDPCGQPNRIPRPVLPAFSFTFENEIDVDRILEELTPNGINYLGELLGYEEDSGSVSEAFEALLSDFETYEELYKHLDSIVETSKKTIF